MLEGLDHGDGHRAFPARHRHTWRATVGAAVGLAELPFWTLRLVAVDSGLAPNRVFVWV